MIGDDVVVMVTSIQGETIKLGIIAPREKIINRGPKVERKPKPPKPKRRKGSHRGRTRAQLDALAAYQPPADAPDDWRFKPLASPTTTSARDFDDED